MWKLILVDGDKYTHSNRSRQAFDLEEVGNYKADVQARWVMRQSRSVFVTAIPCYVGHDNIGGWPDEGEYVLLAVDNHRTRKLINDHCSYLRDVVLISGGNELTDGNVQVYIRRGGRDVTPDLSAYHPEIAAPVDKAPFEKSCEELAVSEPQVLATNLMAASLMLNAFWLIANSVADPPYNEVYFDIKHNTAYPQRRKV